MSMWSASWARARGEESNSSIARPISESGSRAKESEHERGSSMALVQRSPDESDPECLISRRDRAAQRNTAFDDKVTSAAWKSKPSWFIVAENDRDDPARKQPCFRVLGQDRGSAHFEITKHTLRKLWPLPVDIETRAHIG